MSARVVHFEVPYDDAERAAAFYRTVFGWEVNAVPELGYTLVQTGPTTEEGMPTEPGFIGGGMLERQDPINTPVITLHVDNMDAAIAAVTANGGAAVGETVPVGDMGIAAYFTDSEGNLMGLWQSLQG